MQANRRDFLIAAGASAGSAMLASCGGGNVESAAPVPVIIPPTPPAPSTPLTRLQAYLSTNAIAALALPAATTSSPQIGWAGALVGSGSAATRLPNGQVIATSSELIGGPVRGRYVAELPGNPVIDGFPCLVANRSYVCKGQPRKISTPTVLRFKTDASVIELSGVVADGTGGHCAVNLIVDGQLVASRVLSSARSAGGWNTATVRIDFGTYAIRSIWLATELHCAYLKIGAADRLFLYDDSTEPQLTVVGDSYLQSNSSTFAVGGALAFEIGARLGIGKVAIDAVGGTGYWNSGSDIGNLNDRLAGHVADNSDIYLVMAGINDYGDVTNPPQLSWPTRTTYEQSVTDYLRNLRAARPEALIVVTAPFCPIPPMSDASYVANVGTNSSGTGDFLYKAQIHKSAIQRVAAPWIYIDVLMGGGWLNSSGTTGDISNLQWFTGGTPGPGTTADNRPGNTRGGGGGGYGGIASVSILDGGQYSQAPDIRASGGTGSGVLLTSSINNAGALTAIHVVSPGTGYGTGNGLPTLDVDTTFQLAPAALGAATLIAGVNPSGSYPLPSFAPAGATASDLNNIYTLLSVDTIHPSPPGVNYLSRRLAQNIYQAVLAL